MLLKKNWTIYSCVTVIVVLLMISPLHAMSQESDNQSKLKDDSNAGNGKVQSQPNEPNTGKANISPIKYEFSLVTRFSLTGDINDGPDKVSINRQEFKFKMDYMRSMHWQFKLEYNAERSFYDFDNGGELIPGTDNPFDEVNEHQIAFRCLYVKSMKWMFFTDLKLAYVVGSYTDNDFSDSLLFDVYGGVIWRISNDFSLIGCFHIENELEDELIILPKVGFQWKILDDLQLNLLGYKLEFVYELNNRWIISLLGEYEIRDYRLSEKSLIPGGALADDRVIVAAILTWKLNSLIQIQLQSGVIPFQVFIIKYSDGHKISEDNTKPVGFIGLTATINF